MLTDDDLNHMSPDEIGNLGMLNRLQLILSFAEGMQYIDSADMKAHEMIIMGLNEAMTILELRLPQEAVEKFYGR